MISHYERYYHDVVGRLRGDRSSTDPLRSVLFEATDRKCSPGIDLTIREENVSWVHAPSTVSRVDGTDVRLSGD